MRTPKQTRSRHGLTVLKARVLVRGLKAIDGRTAAAQSLVAWKAELLRDLGGAESVSAQRMALVEMAVRTRLFVDHVDSFLLEQRSLVNRRRKAILPILRERTQLVDSLSRLLGQLGLNRIERDGGALPESWIEKVRPHEEPEAQRQDEAPGDGVTGIPGIPPEGKRL